MHALQKCQNAFLGNQAKYSSVFSMFLFFCFFPGEFYQKPSLSFRPLLPLWHWLSTPLPHRISLHLLGTEGCWWMPPMPPWTVLWQACNSRALRCSPMSCWVNTSATSVSSPHSDCTVLPFFHNRYLLCWLHWFHLWRRWSKKIFFFPSLPLSVSPSCLIQSVLTLYLKAFWIYV